MSRSPTEKAGIFSRNLRYPSFLLGMMDQTSKFGDEQKALVKSFHPPSSIGGRVNVPKAAARQWWCLPEKYGVFTCIAGGLHAAASMKCAYAELLKLWCYNRSSTPQLTYTFQVRVEDS
ncbi:hypothetical protein R1flu_020186 [Riccia fluitans]|uniref:Uncharacterized protein n=1 Tax=Riccia fluitans TaxID=41844 RepID=A0ABD1ZKT8_9MARC